MPTYYLQAMAGIGECFRRSCLTTICMRWLKLMNTFGVQLISALNIYFFGGAATGVPW